MCVVEFNDIYTDFNTIKHQQD